MVENVYIERFTKGLNDKIKIPDFVSVFNLKNEVVQEALEHILTAKIEDLKLRLKEKEDYVTNYIDYSLEYFLRRKYELTTQIIERKLVEDKSGIDDKVLALIFNKLQYKDQENLVLKMIQANQFARACEFVRGLNDQQFVNLINKIDYDHLIKLFDANLDIAIGGSFDYHLSKLGYGIDQLLKLEKDNSQDGTSKLLGKAIQKKRLTFADQFTDKGVKFTENNENNKQKIIENLEQQNSLAIYYLNNIDQTKATNIISELDDKQLYHLVELHTKNALDNKDKVEQSTYSNQSKSSPLQNEKLIKAMLLYSSKIDNDKKASLLEQAIQSKNSELVCQMAMEGFKLNDKVIKKAKNESSIAHISKNILSNKSFVSKKNITENDQLRIMVLAASGKNKNEIKEFLTKNKGMLPVKMAIELHLFDLAKNLIQNGNTLKANELNIFERVKLDIQSLYSNSKEMLKDISLKATNKPNEISK